MKNKALILFLSIILFCVGVVGGALGITYITLPSTDILDVASDVYYSMSNGEGAVLSGDVPVAQDGAVSVHFLELGNKYTGDCTYIKVGKDIDILIDCGSKSNSISTVSSYLNNYVVDGSLEYVIITHAHQDHYAGFATTEKMDSIFDLYECENIITFTRSNQKCVTEDTLNIHTPNKGVSQKNTLYDNFIRELKDEKDNGANVYTANEWIDAYDNGIKFLDLDNHISLQVLKSKFYALDDEGYADSENDYSVCTLLSHGEKDFLFTGDLEEEGEKELLSLNPDLGQVDLYKAGHHGSKTSSTVEFLEVIKPKKVCVCCCAGSSEYTKKVENQFPTVEFIANISMYTTKVYVTTMCVDYDNDEFVSFNGNIVVVSESYSNNSTTVYCSASKLELKDSEWFKLNRLELCKLRENFHSSWM